MDYDIVIIGAGPAGLSLAISLRQSGLKVAVIEKQSLEQLSNPAVDGRDIALTHLSRKLMQQHGSWQQIDPANISTIARAEVIDGNSPYTLSFDSPAKKDEPLGYLVANNIIRKAVFDEFKGVENTTLMTDTEVEQVNVSDEAASVHLASGETITASLLIAADTRFSATRRQAGISADSHDFGRTAIVCEMSHEISHDNTAFECFHYGRTLAILPMPGNTSSIVVTAPSDQAQSILDMDDASFASDIQQRLGNRLGNMEQIGERYAYPLVAVHANQFYTQRFALIGDAAVGMHPVTAHGFNLGLSGQDLLAEEILKAVAKGRDFWAPSLLARYQQKHMLTTRPLYHGTNSVVGLFTNDNFPATLVRKAVLRLSNKIPPIKWAIRQKLMSKHQLSSFLPPLP